MRCRERGSRLRPRFVSFQLRGDRYVAFMGMRDALEVLRGGGEGGEPRLSGDRAGSEPELDEFLARAARLYQRHVEEMRGLVSRIFCIRNAGTPLPASVGWDLGDAVLRLRHELEEMSLELDDLYGHLERDTGVSRSFLKRAVSFRRYLPDRSRVPSNATWNRCSRRPRTAALEIMRGNTGPVPKETVGDRGTGEGPGGA